MSRTIHNLMTDALYLARGVTPIDTGNLRYNATYGRQRNTGFDIVFDHRFAHYIKYVDADQEFIEAARLTIAALMNGYYNQGTGLTARQRKNMYERDYRAKRKNVQERNLRLRQSLRKAGLTINDTTTRS